MVATSTLASMLKSLTGIFRWWVCVMPWEAGLRVRAGRWVKVLRRGIHLRVPFIDSVYKQTTRLRVASMPMQTLTTKDGKTVSVTAAVGYSIKDIRVLYEKLHQPETTIANIAMSGLASFVNTHALDECTPAKIEAATLELLKLEEYGLGEGYVKVVSYAVARTMRLLMDTHWHHEGLTLDGQVGQSS